MYIPVRYLYGNISQKPISICQPLVSKIIFWFSDCSEAHPCCVHKDLDEFFYPAWRLQSDMLLQEFCHCKSQHCLEAANVESKADFTYRFLISPLRHSHPQCSFQSTPSTCSHPGPCLHARAASLPRRRSRGGMARGPSGGPASLRFGRRRGRSGCRRYRLHTISSGQVSFPCAGLTLELFGGLDLGLGDAKGVAVVDVKLHFVEDVGDDFV